MLALVSILIGLIFFVTCTIMLWYMMTQPKKWAYFVEIENAFWVRRGFPAKWAAACKECEQGTAFKVLVAFTMLVAAVLTILPFILPFLFPRHR